MHTAAIYRPAQPKIENKTKQQQQKCETFITWKRKKKQMKNAIMIFDEQTNERRTNHKRANGQGHGKLLVAWKLAEKCH